MKHENAKLRITRRRFVRIVKCLESLKTSKIENAYSFFHEEKGFVLDRAMYGNYCAIVEDVRSATHDWIQAYSFEDVQDRMSRGILNSDNSEDALVATIECLDNDISDYIAFVPFSGLHLEHGSTISFGSCEILTLGKDGFERKILSRLRQHLDSISAEERDREISRVSMLLQTIPNMPTMMLQQRCCVSYVVSKIESRADRVAEFLQFCVAICAREYERQIVDWRGQYVGRFMTTIPVMTIEYDRFNLPNVRGSVATHCFDADDLAKLDDMGVLRLARLAIEPDTRRDSVNQMLWRSIAMVADGERSVNPRQSLMAYVSACEALFSKKGVAQEMTCAGMAISVAKTDADLTIAYKAARNVYSARSATTHSGADASLVIEARRFAIACVLTVASKSFAFQDRRQILEWVKAKLPTITTC